jgi:hypothetical protein
MEKTSIDSEQHCIQIKTTLMNLLAIETVHKTAIITENESNDTEMPHSLASTNNSHKSGIYQVYNKNLYSL